MGAYDERIPAPPCQFCGQRMFAEWQGGGIFTFHLRSGEFLCPEPVEYIPPKKKTYHKPGRNRPKKGSE